MNSVRIGSILILFTSTFASVLNAQELGSTGTAQTNVIPDSLNPLIAELRLRAEEFKKAYNTNDVATLAALYDENADYVSPHVPDLMIHGRERIKQNFKKGIAMGGHIDSIQVLTSGSSGQLAYMVTTYVATNNGVTVKGKNVLVMKREKGKWLIVAHASVVRD